MRRILSRFSLSRIIAIPMMLAILLISVLSLSLFLWSFDEYTDETVDSEVEEIRFFIREYFAHLNRDMEQLLNQSTALSHQHLLDLSDSTTIEDFVLTSLNHFQAVDGMFFLSEDQNSGLFMTRGESYYEVSFNDESNPKQYKTYSLDENGRYLDLKGVWHGKDVYQANWFKNANHQISIDINKDPLVVAEHHTPGIIASKSVVRNGESEGVFAVFVSYEKISEYITDFAKSQGIILYIVDNKRNMVASSLQGDLYYEEGKEYIRYKDTDSPNETLNSIAEQRRLGLENASSFEMKIDDENYLFFDENIRVFQQDFNIVLGFPSKIIYASIYTYVRRFAVMITLILLVSLLLIHISIKLISAPLVDLNHLMLDMKNGKLGYEQFTERNDIIGNLIRTFNEMSLSNYVLINELKDKQEELKGLNRDLEKRVQKRTEELEKISITDELTKAYNRRFLVETLTNQIRICNRYDYDVSIIIIDIDYFKRINDKYGHLEGDQVLKAFVGYLNDNIRDATIVGRYGGEEFMLVLPNTDLKGARTLAIRLLRGLASKKFGDKKSSLTASFGVATLHSDDTLESFIHRADLALYNAKDFGRNNVMTEDELQKK